MSEYMLVNKQSLTNIANALREKGISGTLTFPDGFIQAINQFESIKIVVPETKLALNFVAGEIPTDSNKYTHMGHVAVGHSSNYIKDDAAWSFTAPTDVTSIIFTLSWNNITDINSNVGWAQTFPYAFYISNSGEEGQLIPEEQSEYKVVKSTEYGSQGTIQITFTNINLVANTTYYLRANYQDYTTKQNLKAFQQNGNFAVILS